LTTCQVGRWKEILLEEESTSSINEAEFAQPLGTAVKIALVQLLQLWGIKLAVTVGHPSGEIAAAYAAGYLSDTEAIVLAYCRGKVVRDINTNGAMMAVGLGAEAVSPYIPAYGGGDVVVACLNSPSSVTLSGNAGAMRRIEVKLKSEETFARFIKTDGKAYHQVICSPPPVFTRLWSVLKCSMSL
jgi:acyl transferase domain-containing protein